MVPDPPDTIDLSGGGIWPAFVVTGFAGDRSMNNGTYVLRAEASDFGRVWVTQTSESVSRLESGEWEFDSGAVITSIDNDAAFPWLVSTWGGPDTPAFVRTLAAPVSVGLGGAAAIAQATMTTSQTGANNDLAYTAVPLGRLGNEILIIYADPSANNASLSVSVVGRTITINLATGAGGAITTTAAQVKAAIEASPAASALVTVVNAPGNNGSGVVTADYQDLADGADGLPPAPVTVAI